MAVWTANLLGWPILQISIARFTLSLPLESFAGDRPFYSIRSWERSGRLYNIFAIKRWKTLLPDGGPWFGGFSKKKVAGRDPAYLQTFILETRRAEFAHWCMLCSFPVFFLWNPLWACLVMVAYAVVANLPFIIVQRYNRLVLTRICARISERQNIYTPVAAP
ncbi:hypothetical protein P8935_01445 [Telmatobacter sp. DSM 110680]|uniref:Glycosyl-4,4'-diaponeurosporenoate acyltransferase n=1 Tax=Telmatobacter sp. DSM 110680 TaxID=3036704 RepID=A0AAU7DIT4_9BACT